MGWIGCCFPSSTNRADRMLFYMNKPLCSTCLEKNVGTKTFQDGCQPKRPDQTTLSVCECHTHTRTIRGKSRISPEEKHLHMLIRGHWHEKYPQKWYRQDLHLGFLQSFILLTRHLVSMCWLLVLVTTPVFHYIQPPSAVITWIRASGHL